MQSYLFLSLAIVAEVAATLLLPATNEFRKPVPTVLMVGLYILSFYFMTLSMRSIPIGIVYAVWSGVGIVLITLFAFIFYQQKQDLPAISGMVLIIVGVVTINLFSKTITHG